MPRSCHPRGSLNVNVSDVFMPLPENGVTPPGAGAPPDTGTNTQAAPGPVPPQAPAMIVPASLETATDSPSCEPVWGPPPTVPAPTNFAFCVQTPFARVNTQAA